MPANSTSPAIGVFVDGANGTSIRFPLPSYSIPFPIKLKPAAFVQLLLAVLPDPTKPPCEPVCRVLSSDSERLCFRPPPPPNEKMIGTGVPFTTYAEVAVGALDVAANSAAV